MKKKFKIKTTDIVMFALLISLNVILSRFLSINAWNTKIGFTFVTVAIAARLYGPVGGAIVGALGDFVGAILFPIGAYFPGFTVTAALMGVCYGIFFKRGTGLKYILPAVLINQVIFSFVIDSYFISVLYNSPYVPLLATRAIQMSEMIVIQTIVLFALSKQYDIIKAHIQRT